MKKCVCVGVSKGRQITQGVLEALARSALAHPARRDTAAQQQRHHRAVRGGSSARRTNDEDGATFSTHDSTHTTLEAPSRSCERGYYKKKCKVSRSKRKWEGRPGLLCWGDGGG